MNPPRLELGAVLDVYALDEDGALAGLVGQARLIQAEIAQAIPPFDAALAASTDDSIAYAVRPAGDAASVPVDVRQTYPGLVSPTEAAAIAAAECPFLLLVEDASVVVMLGLSAPLADLDDGEICQASALCKIACFWFCPNC